MDPDNPWIACSIRGPPKLKDAKHGLGQSMDSPGQSVDMPKPQSGRYMAFTKRVQLYVKVDLSVIENDDRTFCKNLLIMCQKKLSYRHSLQNHVAIICLKTALGIFLHFLEAILYTECTGPYPFCFQACGRNKRRGCV